VTFFRDINPKGTGGRILQISSMGGFIGNMTGAFYQAGKFGTSSKPASAQSPRALHSPALEGFSEALQADFPGEWNIRITVVEPGGFRTEWAKSPLAVVPQHPAYSDPTTPTSQVQAYIFGPYVGWEIPPKPPKR